MEINKHRSSNIELYRIFVMLSIIAHHYVINSSLLGEAFFENYFSWTNLFYLIFGMWGKVGINSFVLITGYYMCVSKITLRKFLKLILEIEFYGIAVFLAFLIFGYSHFSWKAFYYAVLPISSIDTGFASCFIIFWLSIPALNILVKGMNRKLHRNIILLFLFTYTFMRYVPDSIVTMNYVSWFIVLYFISSYIRLYPDTIYKSDDTKTWCIISILAVIIAVFSLIFIYWVYNCLGKNNLPYGLVYDCNAILAIVVAVATFMFFKNWKIPHSSLINAMGATTFGVLLIHTNSNTMRQWLWSDVVNCVGHYQTRLYWAYAIFSVVCIFCACSVIDYIRICTIEKYFFDKVYKCE